MNTHFRHFWTHIQFDTYSGEIKGRIKYLSWQGFQRVCLSGSTANPDEVRDKLRDAYEKVEDAPKILFDLSDVETLASNAIATLATIVVTKKRDDQRVFILVKPEYKRIYFDSRTWANDIVFTEDAEIPRDV